MAALAFLPSECREEGLPNVEVRYGTIASNTSFATGVVAALSR
jgi:hypothetical protein